MITNNNEKLEKILSEAIELQEKGKSIPEILNLFPEHKETLQEIFQTITILKTQKAQIAPTKELLAQIISRLKVNEGVTKQESSRYLYRGTKKGRSSLITIIKNQYTMATKWKIIVPVGILALVVAVIMVTQLGGKREIAGPQPTEQQAPLAEVPVTPLAKPPVATGNVDDVVNSLFTDSSDEIAQISKAMDDDVALIGLDSQAISDFGQSYNENDF